MQSCPSDKMSSDGVLLCLEVLLLRQEELEAARRVARPARVLRDLDTLVLADALLRLGVLSGLLLLGPARGLELGLGLDDTALEEVYVMTLEWPTRRASMGPCTSPRARR